MGVTKSRDVDKIIKEITTLSQEEKQKLIEQLPRVLELEQEDMELPSLAERSFEFWDNEKDASYDNL